MSRALLRHTKVTETGEPLATATDTRPLRQSRAINFRLPILDSYLLREMAGPFLFALAAFFIFWAFNIFFVAADYEINAHAPFFLVLRFVIFRMPQAVPMAFPFASLFAALLAMSRLMGDNEITAMRTSGVPLWRFALTPVLFGVAMFGLCYAINEYVSPVSVDLSTRSFYQIVYRTEQLPVEAQFFRRDPDTGNVFYVTQVEDDGKTMDGVQIFKPGLGGTRWRETLQAKTATVEGSNMILHDAILTTFNADGDSNTNAPVKTFKIGLPLAETAAQFMSSVNNDPWTMSTKTLKSQVQALQAQGMGGAALGNLQLNLANKIAWPFACVIAVILALPLALRFGRRGRTLGAALAIVAFFIYFLLTDALAALGRNGAMDPYLAAWLPNVIMGAVGITLFWIEEH
jgi:lipopolysaccharide export system permease protein